MRTLDVRIKVTPEVLRESGAFEGSDRSVCGAHSGRSLQYDNIRVRSACRSLSSLSTDPSSCSSCPVEAQEGEGEARARGLRSRAKFFKQKLTRKCLNKVTSFSLFK
jgi:hypothetical protein